MTLEYSTALRDFLQGFGSKKQALMNGVFDIYSMAAPASPNDSVGTAVKLVRVTLASGAWTPEVLSMGTVTFTGSGGSVTALTVNSISVISAAVAYVDSLTNLAAAVAANINAYWSNPKYFAYSSGAVLYIRALPGTGTGPNGYAVVTTVSGGTLGKTDVNLGTGAAGVAPVNGLTYGAPTLGNLPKVGVFSGVVLANGSAGFFRITGSVADNGGADVSPWNQIRLQGTCGTSGADYNMQTTSLIIGATHTIDGWDEILSE